MKKIIILFMLLTLISINLQSQVLQRWVSRYNGSANQNDAVTSLIIAPDNKIIVSGYVQNSVTGFDYQIIKYNTYGDTLWKRTYNGYSNSDDRIYAMAKDKFGNFYVFGTSNASGNTVVLIKYNSNGVQQWLQTNNCAITNYQKDYNITCDDSANVYICFPTGSSGNYDITTIKYNQNGNLQWTQTYNGLGNGNDIPCGIIVDYDRNVYVTGRSTYQGLDIVTIKYNNIGSQQWANLYYWTGTGIDWPSAGICYNSKYNLIVVGGFCYTASGGSGYDYVVLTYYPSGVLYWARQYGGAGNDSDYGSDLAVDSLGNVYITGISWKPGYYNTTMKYDFNGSLQWSRDTSASSTGNFENFSIVVDSIGNSYITGDNNNGDIFTTKYNPNGDRQWYYTYNGTGNGADKPRAIALLPNDTLYIAGESYGGSTTNNDWFTLRYSPSLPLTAILNNVYRANDGRSQTTNIILSDSLCRGQIDSTFWYVNDSLVNKQHSFNYPYKQGTSKVKLIIKNNYGGADSINSTVTRSIWKKFTNGQILAGISLIGDSILYAVSTGDAVYKMDINGNIIYPLAVGGNVLSSCSIANDTNVFIASTDNNLYGFKNDGSNLWPPIPLGGQATTTPTIDSLSNRLYVGVANGFFRAINRTNGFGAWSYFCNAPVKSSAVISYDRKLVVASAIGTIYGFNLNNANPSPPNWILNLNDSVLFSPAIDTSGYFYFGSRGGKVYKIALTGTSTATIVWQTALASAVTSSPTIDANGNIYVGTADGKFYSLNKSGGIRWFFQSPAQIKSTAAITAYQRIYFGNDAGEIYGLDTNKNIKFYYIDSAKISCSMLHHKGTLYFGNEAGRLFALYDSTGGSKGPWTPIWGTFQNNPRRTGDQSNRIPVPLTPVLLSPPNGFSGLSLTPLLDWDDTPFAQKFRVQLATDSLFSGIVYDTSNVYVSLLTVPAGKLNFNTKYFWRVNGQNATGISQWSGAWWFTTALAVPPPVLISPLNSAIGVSLTPSLIWSSITMATSYRFQISTNSGFTSIILDSTVYSTAVNIPAGKLGSITQYYWRVASISTAGQGSFCSPWSFTTRNNLILNLKTYLEGFWNGSSMIPDTANIYIANASSPFGFLDSAVIVFSTSATATAIFSLPPNGNYYVAIKHRNHLETWSRLSQSFVTNIAVNYDFTTDSAKAYGFNMKKVGSDWVLIVGDANQDGSIDAVDVSDLIIQYGNIGYLSCDFNGDGSVDAADVPYMIENYGLTKVVPSLISTITPSEKKKNVIDKIKKDKTEQKKGKEQKLNNN